MPFDNKYFRSQDVLLCAAFGLSKRTPTLVGSPNVGNQSPYVGFFTRRKLWTHTRLEDWPYR